MSNPPAPEATQKPHEPANDTPTEATTDHGHNAVEDAKKYRKRAQAAEAKLEDMQQRFDAQTALTTNMAKSIAEQTAMKEGVNSHALWSTPGVDPMSMFDETGKLDLLKLRDAVRLAKETFGIGGAEAPGEQGHSAPKTTGITWSKALGKG